MPDSQIHLLVVDDEMPILDAYEHHFGDTHTVLTAETYGAATELIDQLTMPLVAVLDHNLQDNDPSHVGYAVCRYLRRRHPFGLLLPVIYNSGYQRNEDFVSALRDDENTLLGPSMFLRKAKRSSMGLGQTFVQVQKVLEQFEMLWETAIKQAAGLALHDAHHGEDLEI